MLFYRNNGNIYLNKVLEGQVADLINANAKLDYMAMMLDVEMPVTESEEMFGGANDEMV